MIELLCRILFSFSPNIKGGFKMKRIKMQMLIALILVISFWLSSCGGGVAVVIDLPAAKVQFVTWINNQQGVPDIAVGNYICTLNEGDVIASEDPMEESVSRQSGPINEAGWLFYLDEQPGGFYPHPGRILAVSQTGNIMFQEQIQGWPTVNQQVPEIFKEPNSTRITEDPGEWTVYNPSHIWIPAVIFKWYEIYPIQLRVYGAVVTCGLTPTQNLYSETMNVSDQMFDALWDLFGCDVGDERVVKVEYPDNQAADIAAAVLDLTTNHNVNNLTLYFIAHGGHQAMNMGGYSYYCSTLDALMDLYPNVHFNLIFETCHGGSWTDYFETLGDTGMPNLDMCISSTTSEKNAYGDMDSAEGINDHNGPQDQYIEFTSDFLLRMEYWTHPDHWGDVIALTNPVLGNNTLKLYYFCYQSTKNRNYPTPGIPLYSSYVLPEREPIQIQEPQIYIP